MNGPPVSICASKIAYQSFCAGIVRLCLPSFSYFSYKASNSAPWTSAMPGASFGQNSDQSPLASTRFMLSPIFVSIQERRWVRRHNNLQQIWDPKGVEQVSSASLLLAVVLPQVDEVEYIIVPWLNVDGECTRTLVTSLIDVP